MSKVKFELNRAGVRELLKSPNMAAICSERASSVRSRAGVGYDVSVKTGANRVYANIYTATPEAMRDNYENNTLLKALGGGA